MDDQYINQLFNRKGADRVIELLSLHFSTVKEIGEYMQRVLGYTPDEYDVEQMVGLL